MFYYFKHFSIKLGLIVLVIIIIATLFQEDNIFGMNASLIYGPNVEMPTVL